MLIKGLGPVRITDLAEQAVMDRTTLKRNVELLQLEGLVRIVPGKDARVRELSVTGAAEERLAQALPSGSAPRHTSPPSWGRVGPSGSWPIFRPVSVSWSGPYEPLFLSIKGVSTLNRRGTT